MTDDTARPGARTFTAEDRQAAVLARRKRQAEHDQAVWPRISELRDQGLSWRQVARTLEDEGVKTARGGGRWQPAQLQRIAQRQAKAPAPTPTPTPPQEPRKSRLHGFLHWLWRCLTH